MKVLIISNNVLSNSNNMGKTILAYFNNFNKDELAQLYIQQEFPTVLDACSSYYRVTDIDVLKSLYKFKINANIYNSVVETENNNSLDKIYEIGRKHTPLISIVRDIVWKIGHWFDKKLKKWLLDFNPDVIFFASGNCNFMYDVAIKISKFLNIPVVNSIYDDYYINNQNKGMFLGKYYYNQLLSKTRKLLKRSLFTIVMCDEMETDYKKMFGTQFKVLYNSSPVFSQEVREVKNIITYLGGISLGRNHQLITLGRALKNTFNNKNIHFIDVYTAEKSHNYLEGLTPENGIRLHNAVSASEVDNILQESLITIHVESFNEEYKNRVKYSFSTKIPNTLSKSNCLLAFGPSDVASIGYLKKYNAAYIIDDDCNLESKLSEIIDDDELRNLLGKNGKLIASKNHNLEHNSNQFKNWIEEALQGEKV